MRRSRRYAGRPSSALNPIERRGLSGLAMNWRITSKSEWRRSPVATGRRVDRATSAHEWTLSGRMGSF